MRVGYRQSFVKDLRKLAKPDAARVQAVIELIEKVETLREIPHLKAMQGRPGFFRVRLGTYRIGLSVDAGEVTLLRCLRRKDIYRQFP